MTRPVGIRLKLAAVCATYIAVVAAGVHPQQQPPRVQVDAEYGTPCLFPQLEVAP